MKIYQSFCSFCSDPRYPDTRWLIEDEAQIICETCGAIHQIEEDGQNYFYLKVIQDGRTKAT